MAFNPICDKPLSKPTVIQFSNTYVRHLREIDLMEIIQILFISNKCYANINDDKFFSRSLIAKFGETYMHRSGIDKWRKIDIAHRCLFFWTYKIDPYSQRSNPKISDTTTCINVIDEKKY